MKAKVEAWNLDDDRYYLAPVTKNSLANSSDYFLSCLPFQAPPCEAVKVDVPILRTSSGRSFLREIRKNLDHLGHKEKNLCASKEKQRFGKGLFVHDGVSSSRAVGLIKTCKPLG